MHNSIVLLLLAGLLAGVGCGKRAAPPSGREPLTVEEWRSIPDDEVKYSRRTMERLKAGTARK